MEGTVSIKIPVEYLKEITCRELIEVTNYMKELNDQFPEFIDQIVNMGSHDEGKVYLWLFGSIYGDFFMDEYYDELLAILPKGNPLEKIPDKYQDQLIFRYDGFYIDDTNKAIMCELLQNYGWYYFFTSILGVYNLVDLIIYAFENNCYVIVDFFNQNDYNFKCNCKKDSDFIKILEHHSLSDYLIKSNEKNFIINYYMDLYFYECSRLTSVSIILNKHQPRYFKHILENLNKKDQESLLIRIMYQYQDNLFEELGITDLVHNLKGILVRFVTYPKTLTYLIDNNIDIDNVRNAFLYAISICNLKATLIILKRHTQLCYEIPTHNVIRLSNLMRRDLERCLNEMPMYLTLQIFDSILCKTIDLTERSTQYNILKLFIEKIGKRIFSYKQLPDFCLLGYQKYCNVCNLFKINCAPEIEYYNALIFCRDSILPDSTYNNLLEFINSNPIPENKKIIHLLSNILSNNKDFLSDDSLRKKIIDCMYLLIKCVIKMNTADNNVNINETINLCVEFLIGKITVETFCEITHDRLDSLSYILCGCLIKLSKFDLLKRFLDLKYPIELNVGFPQNICSSIFNSILELPNIDEILTKLDYPGGRINLNLLTITNRLTSRIYDYLTPYIRRTNNIIHTFKILFKYGLDANLDNTHLFRKICVMVDMTLPVMTRDKFEKRKRKLNREPHIMIELISLFIEHGANIKLILDTENLRSEVFYVLEDNMIITRSLFTKRSRCYNTDVHDTLDSRDADDADDANDDLEPNAKRKKNN